MHTSPTRSCTTSWAWPSWVRRAAACRVRKREILVREPDAGNLHVRFDEREVETEQGMRYLATKGKPGYSEIPPPKTTAPPLDSTGNAMGCGRSPPYGLNEISQAG